MKYHICSDKDDGVVSISLSKNCDYMNGFINIWVDTDEDDDESIFKNIDDAKIFAEMIVKLLEAIK